MRSNLLQCCREKFSYYHTHKVRHGFFFFFFNLTFLRTKYNTVFTFYSVIFQHTYTRIEKKIRFWKGLFFFFFSFIPQVPDYPWNSSVGWRFSCDFKRVRFRDIRILSRRKSMLARRTTEICVRRTRAANLMTYGVSAYCVRAIVVFVTLLSRVSPCAPEVKCPTKTYAPTTLCGEFLTQENFKH